MKIDFLQRVPDEAAEPEDNEDTAYLRNPTTGSYWSLGSMLIFSLGKMQKQDRNEKKQLYNLRTRIRRAMKERKAINIEARELTLMEDSADIFLNDNSEPLKELLSAISKEDAKEGNNRLSKEEAEIEEEEAEIAKANGQ